MEPDKRSCDICGRTYELKPIIFPSVSKYPVHMDSSSVRVQFALPKKTEIYDFKTCPHCAEQIHRYIFGIQKNRPKKCEFCEFDRGRLVQTPVECGTCSNFSNFQLKKKMHPRQAHEWQMYERYLMGGE